MKNGRNPIFAKVTGVVSRVWAKTGTIPLSRDSLMPRYPYAACSTVAMKSEQLAELTSDSSSSQLLIGSLSVVELTKKRVVKVCWE